MNIESLRTIIVEPSPVSVPQQTESLANSTPVVSSATNSNQILNVISSKEATSKDGVSVSSAASNAVAQNPEVLRQHVDKMNSVMQAMDKDLQFSLDDRLKNEMVVKVVNSKTGNVIRQYPAEEIINMMKRLDDALQGVLVDNKA